MLTTNSSIASKLEAAVASAEPADTLKALVGELKKDGLSQDALYNVVFQIFCLHQEHAHDERIDALAQTLELIRLRFPEL